MRALAIFVAVFPAMIVVGAILAPVLNNRRPRNRIEGRAEQGAAAHVRSSTQRMLVQVAETGLEQESKEGFCPGADDRDQYLTDWTALQEEFCG